ncbi:hypothetical protein MW887_000831 [Aspergillus wentii]|nr:hypothetical protein MW887_000831 [Aspergillus wentii]
MRLIKANGVEADRFEVREFYDANIPPYAILSHTWGDDEVTLRDLEETNAKRREEYDIFRTYRFTGRSDRRKRKGYSKIRGACSIAKNDSFDYVWIDTCCIDKTSSAELSESINSMYRWYEEAEVCYVCLADVSSMGDFSNSRWFTRGWTLQELIAPLKVIFLDRNWKVLGTKESLQAKISDRTRIPVDILTGTGDLDRVPVAQRMAWAATRQTSRLEDRAYSLLGIFGINMPMLYGEGKMAFARLQEEIMKVYEDFTLFAWRSSDENHGELLAISPDAFKDSSDFDLDYNPNDTVNPSWVLDGKGMHLELPFMPIGHGGLGVALIFCS